MSVADMRIIETDADILEGLAHLKKRDRKLAPVIERVGTVPLRRHKPGFAGLCDIVISQQLSVASANAIMTRTVSGIGELVPAAILAADDPALRACGLSGPKMRTLRAVADAAHSGALPIASLHTMPVDEAVALMTAVKGIGPWTAEIYLMFSAAHPDIFPAGDLALQVGVQWAFGLDARPAIKDVRETASAWSPYRSTAALLFWRYYRAVRNREGLLL